MVKIKRIESCDICEDSVIYYESQNVPSFVVHTDAGDLCPKCFSKWEKYVKNFVKSKGDVNE